MSETTFTRRTFVKGSGSLIIGFSLLGTTPMTALGAPEGEAVGVWPKPDVNQVDSFLEILSDGRVVGKVGKGTGSMGLITSIQQLFAEELDVPMDKITMKVGDSFLTPDQVGASGSNGMVTEWATVRQAAATARAKLLELASAKLGAPVSALSVKDGVVSGAGKSASYGELIGGQKFNLAISAKAAQKDPAQFKVVGTSPPRTEIPHIVNGTYPYVMDVRLPGMLHARNIKPPVAGAELVSVDGPHNLPGLVKVVSKGNYLAVVAKTEWQAVQAASALKVTWKNPPAPKFPNGYDELYAYMGSSKPLATQTRTKVGDAPGAIAKAAKKVSATYMHDFQSHASMAGTCAVADVRKDGTCVIYFGGQKPYGAAYPTAELLGIPVENIRVIWYPGPGSYGRNDADDGGIEAAFLSQQVGAPVRIQWMRSEVQQWDTKAPPHLTTLEAGIDASGKVIAWNWTARSISSSHTPAAAKVPGDTLAGNLMGIQTPQGNRGAFDSQSYGFANMLETAHAVEWGQGLGTGLRAANMRDPNGPQATFASEQFVDELAHAVGQDPIQFRLAYLTDERDRNVVRQVATAAGWQTRPGPNPKAGKGDVVKGRGIAYQTRSGTVNATVAEVEVNRKTGHVQVTRFVHAQDAGYVVNPKAITGTIEENLMMSLGRALKESVQFNSREVTSLDWETYPIASIVDLPDVKVVLVNADGKGVDGKFVSPSGAGEPSTRPTVAAIANAVFDATGVRVRRAPLTPKIVLAALKAAGRAA
jgi:CO/xanthine dehydrogenase Mo-binding subunit